MFGLEPTGNGNSEPATNHNRPPNLTWTNQNQPGFQICTFAVL